MGLPRAVLVKRSVNLVMEQNSSLMGCEIEQLGSFYAGNDILSFGLNHSADLTVAFADLTLRSKVKARNHSHWLHLLDQGIKMKISAGVYRHILFLMLYYKFKCTVSV